MVCPLWVCVPLLLPVLLPAQDRVVIRCNCVQPDPRTGTRLVNDDALSM